MNITPDAQAAKAETRLKGHLGHLTKEEQAAFTAFKELAAKEGYYIPPTATSKASHDDGTLMYANDLDSLSILDLMTLQPIYKSSKIRAPGRLRPIQGYGDLAPAE